MSDEIRILLNGSEEDRCWALSQYLLGELSPSETDVFESCLESDASLCELMVREGRFLRQVTKAFGTERAREQRLDPLTAFSADAAVVSSPVAVRVAVQSLRVGLRRSTIAGTACAVAVLFLLAVAVTTSQRGTREATFTADDDLAVADAFLALMPESGFSVNSGNAYPADTGLLADDVESGADFNDVQAPEWLLTAVSLEVDDQDESEVQGGGLF